MKSVFYKYQTILLKFNNYQKRHFYVSSKFFDLKNVGMLFV